MALTDPYLQIDDVTFGYSSRVILDDVNLSFGRGQVVAIMGGDGELAGQFVVLSTVASVVTIFLWVYFLNSIGWLA